jgi:hypothetical protein
MDWYLSIYLNQSGKDIVSRIQSMKSFLTKLNNKEINKYKLTNTDLAVLDELYSHNYQHTQEWLNHYKRLPPKSLLDEDENILTVRPSEPTINYNTINTVLRMLPRQSHSRTHTPYYQSRMNTWGGTKYHKTNKRYKYHSHNYVVYKDELQQAYIRYQHKYVLISSLSI